MSEYVVDIGEADKKHIEMFHVQVETLFGHPVREEIVRCGDCKNFEKMAGGFGVCHPLSLVLMNMEEKGFCAWGDRRES